MAFYPFGLKEVNTKKAKLIGTLRGIFGPSTGDGEGIFFSVQSFCLVCTYILGSTGKVSCRQGWGAHCEALGDDVMFFCFLTRRNTIHRDVVDFSC